MKKVYLFKSANKAWKSYLKEIRRRKKYHRKVAGYQKFLSDANRKRKIIKRSESNIKKKKYILKHKPIQPKVSSNLIFLKSQKNLFSTNNVPSNDTPLIVPVCFSLIDKYEESFDFLKQLFYTLLKGNIEELVIDYKECKRIDVDSSICMDLLLAEFIVHFKKCQASHVNILPTSIVPINFDAPQIKKVLFSIGAFRNIKNVTISYEDIEPLPLMIGSKKFINHDEDVEIDLTKTVEYIKKCLNRLNRDLTADAENSLYKVLGEIMTNAEEHGTLAYRYSVGYFREYNHSEEHYGIFNFTIFNLGDTIFDTFKKPTCKNQKAVQQMTNLSQSYTAKGFFRSAEFEEETLWTLYALQDRVTSKEKKRGSGTIKFIENFFKLKGDLESDKISRLVIHSGNTRIIFDGTYKIIEKQRMKEKRTYKMITFNESGDINDQPNKKYVNFTNNYFPGTIISARILIKDNNTNIE